MLLEATGGPLSYRWPGGEILFEPGNPVEIPNERAQRVLEKAGKRLRVVLSRQPDVVLCVGNKVTWRSPLFGHLSGEILELLDDKEIVVFHPLTATLCKIPRSWALV
jgi:hypothetical protein